MDKSLEEKILSSQNQSWFTEEGEMDDESSFIAWKDALKAMREYSDTKNLKLRDALDEIANPIKYIQLRAQSNGNGINGQVAIQLSNDPNHLKQIAEKALKID